jgi:hypothetical protein
MGWSLPSAAELPVGTPVWWWQDARGNTEHLDERSWDAPPTTHTFEFVRLDVAEEPLGLDLASEALGALVAARVAVADTPAQPPAPLPRAS